MAIEITTLALAKKYVESTLQNAGALKGDPGLDGKSAYQYAQDGGYTGTEEEFAQKLAKEIKVDSELSEESENPVQNKVVAQKFSQLSEQIDSHVHSWNNLTDKPFYETQEEKQIDIVPLQQVTFTDGVAKLVDVKDPCYDLGIVNEREYLQATLEINGEVIDGQLYYYYVATGTFGNYYVDLGGCTIRLQDGASVKDGDTVEVRVYENAVVEEVKTLDTKFLPKNVPVATSESGLRDVIIVSEVDKNGLPKSWKTINIKDLVIPFIHYVIEDKNLTVTVENSETIVFENVDITRRFAIKIVTGSSIPNRAKIYLYCGDTYDVPSASIVTKDTITGRNMIFCNRIYDDIYISEITSTGTIASSIDRESFTTDSTFNITKIVIQDTDGGTLFTGEYDLLYF